MKPFPVRLVVVMAATMMLLAVQAGAAVAQSGTRSPARSGRSAMTQSGTRSGRSVSQPQKSFDQKLWDYLTAAKYTNWAPVPGKSDGFAEGGSPHGAFVKMYLNRTAAGNFKELPDGSVVVKENYGPQKKKLMAITVMYRSKGYNPEAGDWYWIKYNPDGTVAKAPPEMNSMPLKGKPGGCIKCHGEGAAGGDFAFLNDE
jgi:Cytochrome P460